MESIIAWSCDFSPTTGEGKLARDFVNRFSNLKKVNFFIHSPGGFSTKIYKKKIFDIRKNKISKSSFLHRFIYPTFGILFLLFNFYLKKKKIAYLNYCPLWNIFIFALLPKHCLLGPITGSNINYQFKFISILKLILANPLYKISIGFIKIKKWSIILSTDILTNIFIKEKYLNYIDNYILLSKLDKKIFVKNKNKDIDLLVYYRIHYNKNNMFYLNICDKLSKDLTIHVFGDYINKPNIINHGKIEQKKVFELLKRSKGTLASSENIFSLFSIEALKYNNLIFYNNKFKTEFLDKFKQFYPISFSNVQYSSIIIFKVIKNFKRKNKFILTNIINKNKINLFFNFLRY